MYEINSVQVYPSVRHSSERASHDDVCLFCCWYILKVKGMGYKMWSFGARDLYLDETCHVSADISSITVCTAGMKSKKRTESGARRT